MFTKTEGNKTMCDIITSFNVLNYCLYWTAIHCEWGEWVPGECSKECGTGTQENARDKLVEEANGGTCDGQRTETVDCMIKECPSKQVFSMFRVAEFQNFPQNRQN